MRIFEELKAHFDLPTLAAEYGIDTSKGKAVCPNCSYKKNPSLTITRDFYKCHHAGCDFKGDLISFTAAMEKTDTWGAVRILAKRAGIDYKPSPDEVARENRAEIYRAFATKYSKLPPAAAAYLQDRGLTKDFIEDHLIGWVPEAPEPETSKTLQEAGLPNLVKGRILLPFWQGRQIVYFTARALDNRLPKYMNQRGPKQHIGALRGPELVITEGIFDQLLAEQAGYNCIGLAGSSAELSIGKGIHKVLIVFDGDRAGREYIDRHAPSLMEQGAEVEIATLREGTDLADWLAAGKRVEDLTKARAIDYFFEILAANKKDKLLKKNFYRLIATLDPIDREDEFKRLAKLWDAGIKAIRTDLTDCLREEQKTEYATEDGFKFQVPEGYQMNGHGVIQNKANITFEPIAITKFGTDRQSREQYYEVHYGNKVQIIPRFAISKAQELLEWSKVGLPVNSANATALVRFLDAWNAANKDKYGTFEVVSQLGWTGAQFVLPDRILPEGDTVHYIDRTIAKDVFTKHGTLKGWVDTMKMLGDFKDGLTGRFLLYAAFASVVLEPFNKRPFIIHLHGDTSIGKTTALRIPASVFGNPVEGKAMIKWKNTEAFIVRYMEKLKNIPLIIDESSSETKSIFESVIYQMESGLSKGKASRTDPMATAALRTFRLGVFSSGEPPVLNDNFLSGAQIRVMEFRGSPFGDVIGKKEFEKFQTGLMKNHGHAIDAFIQKFGQAKAEIEELAAAGFPYPGTDDLSSIEARTKTQLDIIWACGETAEAIFNFGFKPQDDMQRIFDTLRGQMQDKGKTLDEILRFINSFYQQNQTSFHKVDIGVTGNTAKIPQNSKVYGYIFDKDLAIIKSVFKDAITKEHNHPNYGSHAIQILRETGHIPKDRIERRVNQAKADFIYISRFLADAEGETDDDKF